MAWIDFFGLIVLAALWGGSYLFIRIGAPALGPFALMDARVLIGGLALVAYAALARRSLGLRDRWRPLLLLGLLNCAVPFTLIATAEIHLTASLAAILNALTPLATAVVSAVWLGDAFTAKKAVGLLTGLAGVSIVVGWSPVPLSAATVLSAAACVLATVSYALGSTYVTRRFAGTPPLTLAAGQQLAAGLILLPFAAIWRPEPSAWLEPAVAASVLGLALLSSAVAFLIFFRLITRSGPTKAVSVTYLVPVFGMLWGAIFLDEPLTPGLFAGLAVILTSIALVTEVRIAGRKGSAAAAAEEAQ